MDPQQWMGAVRMRVQTADKNTTSNPHHSSPSVLWIQNLLVINHIIIFFIKTVWSHFILRSNSCYLQTINYDFCLNKLLICRFVWRWVLWVDYGNMKQLKEYPDNSFWSYTASSSRRVPAFSLSLFVFRTRCQFHRSSETKIWKDACSDRCDIAASDGSKTKTHLTCQFAPL